MNILLIEDEEALSEVAAIQLRSLGNSVTTVSNLEEAARVIEAPRHRPDLILADHRLPDGRGIDFVIERVRAGCPIPAIVVSGCLTIADVALLEKEGIDYYRKPVIYSEVVRRFVQSHGPPPLSEPVDEGEPPVEPRDRGERSGILGGLFSRRRRYR